MKTIDLLISGLTDTQKRELLEEVTSIYSSSSPDFVFDFFSASCHEFAHTLNNFHYYDRLSSLEESIKKQKNRKACKPHIF